jgi:hypothetical protein
MAATADPAKTATFRDRFARVAVDAFIITRPIYVSGCEADCAPQRAPSENPSNQRRIRDGGFPIKWARKPREGVVADAREYGDDLLDHGIGEVFLLGVAAHVCGP